MDTKTTFPTAVTRTGALGAVLLLVGCAVPFPVYTVSTTNITSIRASQRSVEVADFSGTQTSVSCRTQPISPEGGRTFAQYIRGAFNDEIIIAGVKPGTAKSRVSLALKNIDVDCAIGTGSWIFEVTVTIDGQRSYDVRTVRTFEGSFAGAIVGQRAYQAFVPSVQQLITDVMAHPTYKMEFGGT